MPTIFKKPTISEKIVGFLKIVGEMQQLVRKRSQKITLHFTSCLSIALSKILPYWKTIKNTKKLSVFGENDSRRLSNYLQTHNFWKFDHISRTCNEINYRNIWFAKVTIILIMMVQVLFFNIFSVKYPHLNAVEFSFIQLYIPSYSKTLSQN